MPYPDRTPDPGSPIAVDQVAAVVGISPNTSLGFLADLIVPEERAPGAQMNNFYSKTYVQRNDQGNCNNGNCNCNGNCGNINCRNCVPGAAINCANCQSQPYLQTNCNCACTYQCDPITTSYNCNCACNCSKIICAKMYEFGLMKQNIWAADQAYGKWLRKTDRSVYQGYVRWARIVTAWMDGKGPNYMPWIKDKEQRIAAQKAAITDMAIKIGTPWSEHMAYLMGAMPQDNTMGRILMTIGKPICRIVNKIPRAGAAKRRHKLPTLYTMWALFYFSYYTAKTLAPVVDFVDTLKITKNKSLKES